VGLPDIYAAWNCVITHRRLLGETNLPLGTTAHKQGRVAEENVLGGNSQFAGNHGITIRVTGDRATGRLLGMQLFGHKNAEIAKRTDIAATAIYHGITVDAVSDLNLSYNPPLGSPWDAVQIAAQAWTCGRY
jgi:hypothetical protein